MKASHILLLLLVLFQTKALSQKSVNIKFQATWGDSPITIQEYEGSNPEQWHFEVLRFYVSNLEFIKDGFPVASWNKKHQLIDLSEEKSSFWNLPISHSLPFDAIRFYMGIDSSTNMGGALGGDLDPINGMYWTWETGYINFKLEGRSPHSKERKNAFDFHIGGYKYPNQTMFSISEALSPGEDLILTLDLEKLFHGFQWLDTGRIMMPGPEAKEFAKKIKKSMSKRG